MRQTKRGLDADSSNVSARAPLLRREGPPMLQLQSSSEQFVRMLPAGAQVNRRPFVPDWQDHALGPIGEAAQADILQLARLRTTDE